MDPDLTKRIVEAALLAASQPLTLVQLNGLFPLDEPAPEGAVAQALEALQADCEGRGVELVEVASGWRYQVKADVHAWVARLWTERQAKYTRATLETLALIAYRQPITRGEIEQVRGVATNSNIIKALEEREWIRVVGHRDIPGRPELLGTTKGFLDYFGLKRLDELPPLSELKDIGELEPQLQFDNVMDDPTPIDAGSLGATPGVEAEAETANAEDLDASDSSESEDDDLATSESEDNLIEGIADAADEDNEAASDGEPESAQGNSAEDENDPEHDESLDDDEDVEQDNAVETTTVPMTDDDADEASSELEKND